MSFAQFDIAAPDGKLDFHSDRTDRNGMFMFLPDREEKYRVTVGDDMGNQLVLAKKIAENGTISASPKKHGNRRFFSGKNEWNSWWAWCDHRVQ
jgi:hypothetical protein